MSNSELVVNVYATKTQTRLVLSDCTRIVFASQSFNHSIDAIYTP